MRCDWRPRSIGRWWFHFRRDWYTSRSIASSNKIYICKFTPRDLGCNSTTFFFIPFSLEIIYSGIRFFELSYRTYFLGIIIVWWIQDDEHEEVKEWVLAISIEQSTERNLPRDTDGNFEVSLIDANGASHPACLISGSFIHFSTNITFSAKHYTSSQIDGSTSSYNRLFLFSRLHNCLLKVIQYAETWKNLDLLVKQPIAIHGVVSSWHKRRNQPKT